MPASTDGFMLLGTSLNPIYSNAEAVQILAYPENPRKLNAVDGYLAKKIHSVLLKVPSAPHSGFVKELQSGRRSYQCRAFSLNSHSNGSQNGPSMALLMERRTKTPLDTFKLAEQHHLTKRELETVEFLIEGLTSKEIAQRMKISPNTVKVFLRLVMVKMGATTRSGIIGKIFEATR